MVEDTVVHVTRRQPQKSHVVHRPLTRHTKSSSRLNKLGGASRSNLHLPQLRAAIPTVATAENDGSSDTPENGSAHRTSVQPKTNVNKAPVLSTMPLTKLSSTAPHKSVIQLERDDDGSQEDEGTDYEDMSSDGEDLSPPTVRPPNQRSDSQLSIGIHPVEPTPPTINTETVVTVTSVADMASALKEARDKSGFVEDADLLSTAISRSQGTADMARIVGASNSNRTQRRQLLKQRQPFDTTHHQPSATANSDGGSREFERIFRIYSNTRQVKNPVLSSFVRITTQSFKQPSNSDTTPSGNSSSARLLNSGRRISSLSATTIEQMSDLSLRSNSAVANGSNEGVTNHVSNYVLNKMWQQGWQDPENPRALKAQDEDNTAASPQDSSIHRQAQKVYNRMARQPLPRRGSSIKLI